MPKNPLDPPVSQWITERGCIIQGVMLKEEEINWIYCAVHRTREHVHSFDREINMHKSPSKEEMKLSEELKQQYCWNNS
jgi:hypothetical protein